MTSDIQSAIDAGRELATQIDTIYGTPFIVLPAGHKFEILSELRLKPNRISEKIKHSTVASFIDYYNRFSTSASVIFLDTNSNEFTAIFDYHDQDSKSDWCDHTSVFKLKSTHEWSSWSANNKKMFSQEEFGRFIEENLMEIVSPANGEMLEIALSLQAKTKVDFSKAIRLDNGQTQLQYIETIDGSAGINGSLKIPEIFSIGLILFEGGSPYQIDARFRYRIKDGNLALWYELIRPHKTVEANVIETTNKILGEMHNGHCFEAAR